MKGLLRSAPIQWVLARLVQGYIELLISTLQWRSLDAGPAAPLLRGESGFIALFWHGRIAHAMACRRLLERKPRAVMISLSRDGAFIADAALSLGIPTIRGSTGRVRDGVDKGGATAFRAALAAIDGGAVMLMTPDGPRGPRETLQLGPVQLAKAAQCPVVLMGLAASPALALKSWDGGRLPLPFARAALCVEGPLPPPMANDPAALETTRIEWQHLMDRARRRAEDQLARA